MSTAIIVAVLLVIAVIAIRDYAKTDFGVLRR